MHFHSLARRTAQESRPLAGAQTTSPLTPAIPGLPHRCPADLGALWLARPMEQLLSPLVTSSRRTLRPLQFPLTRALPGATRILRGHGCLSVPQQMEAGSLS